MWTVRKVMSERVVGEWFAFFLGLMLIVGVVSAASGPVGAQLVINEIHYHPSSGLKDDEFIELHHGRPARLPPRASGFRPRGTPSHLHRPHAVT